MAKYEISEQTVGTATKNPRTVKRILVERDNGTKIDLLVSDLKGEIHGYKMLDNGGNVIAFMVSEDGDYYLKQPGREQMVVNFRIGVPQNFANKILEEFGER